MKLDQTNRRSIAVASMFVVYFSFTAWSPDSFYNTNMYQPLWNGVTNILIFAFYIFVAVWVLTNARQRNQLMVIVSTASVILVSVLFFNLFVYSIVG